MDDYRWLAETAKRVLKDDTPLLTFCGIGYLPETLDALRSGGLNYRWELTSAWNGGSAHIPLGFCKQARILWFDKSGTSKPQRQLVDYRQSVVNYSKLPNSAAHDWTKIPDHIAYYLAGFVPVGGVVADFFSGWGTIPVVCKLLGYSYLAFEIVPEVAKQSRERIVATQPPLIMPEAKQITLEV